MSKAMGRQSEMELQKHLAMDDQLEDELQRRLAIYEQNPRSCAERYQDMIRKIKFLKLKYGGIPRILLLVFIVALLVLLQACGSGSGAETVQNQDTSQAAGGSFVYQGPAPQTEDVQNFKINLYDNLVEDRCGTCHGVDQAPEFLSRNDINHAYQETNTNNLVDLGQPSLSRLVTKVGEGHNCWTDNNQVCADIMTNYIESWASSTDSQSNVIVLTAPEIKDPGAPKTFPADATDFANTVYPLLTAYCADCHSETSAQQQQPFFASNNLQLAYDNARLRMDLESPGSSRFVIRLGSESHNCWSDCGANASAIETQISNFSNSIELTEVDASLVSSKALGLFDGVVASSGGRAESHVIALYEFKTGEGFIAYDTSGVDPATHLNISGDVDWISSWGLRINDGKAQASTSSSAKIHDTITGTGEYSIEAWVVPANVTQEGPARIISYSGGDDTRNFSLGQTLYNYNYQNRSTATDADGSPMVSTPDAAEVLQATLQHVVAAYDPVNGRRIYVNGQLVSEADTASGGTLTDWDNSFALVLGNEVTSNFLWQGSIRLLAIHNRALSPEDIRSNYDAGVGQRYFLLFSISDLVEVDHAYIVFEVQQFDDYSYLFNQPFFFVLEGDGSTVNSTQLQGMRIGINGKEAAQGQAYANLDMNLSGIEYGAMGQPLSDLGTIIAVENGAEADEFFLTFDQLGNNSFVRTDTPVIVSTSPVNSEQSVVGIKTFEQINATLSEVTGVPRTNAAVSSTFEQVKQQLPTSPRIEGFLSAHQMGVTQLAVEYCNQLTAPENGLRNSFFAGFNFNAPANSAFSSSADRALITSPLLASLLAHELDSSEGSELFDQPDPDEVLAELDGLFDIMQSSCGNGCSAENTRTTVTSICAAATGSALMLIQ